MVQLHTVHRQLGVVRPTNDVDIVLHIETSRGIPSLTAAALEGIGYRPRAAADPRDNTAHRFVRGSSTVDVVAGDEVVDVLLADHPAPAVIETLRGREMVRIEGGTQALKRTVNARLRITPDSTTTLSVPRPLGALILKSAAYGTDSRDRDRHLYDAVALLACITDPITERAKLTGSDRGRLLRLSTTLAQGHPAWRTLQGDARRDAETALRILAPTQPPR